MIPSSITRIPYIQITISAMLTIFRLGYYGKLIAVITLVHMSIRYFSSSSAVQPVRNGSFTDRESKSSSNHLCVPLINFPLRQRISLSSLFSYQYKRYATLLSYRTLALSRQRHSLESGSPQCSFHNYWILCL